MTTPIIILDVWLSGSSGGDFTSTTQNSRQFRETTHTLPIPISLILRNRFPAVRTLCPVQQPKTLQTPPIPQLYPYSHHDHHTHLLPQPLTWVQPQLPPVPRLAPVEVRHHRGLKARQLLCGVGRHPPRPLPQLRSAQGDGGGTGDVQHLPGDQRGTSLEPVWSGLVPNSSELHPVWDWIRAMCTAVTKSDGRL